MTTWGDTTTIYSTVVDETTIDVTTEPTTKSTTGKQTIEPSTRSSERETRARSIPEIVDLGSSEGSGDNDVV